MPSVIGWDRGIDDFPCSYSCLSSWGWKGAYRLIGLMLHFLTTPSSFALPACCLLLHSLLPVGVNSVYWLVAASDKSKSRASSNRKRARSSMQNHTPSFARCSPSKRGSHEDWKFRILPLYYFLFLNVLNVCSLSQIYNETLTHFLRVGCCQLSLVIHLESKNRPSSSHEITWNSTVHWIRTLKFQLTYTPRRTRTCSFWNKIMISDEGGNLTIQTPGVPYRSVSYKVHVLESTRRVDGNPTSFIRRHIQVDQIVYSTDALSTQSLIEVISAMYY